MAPEISIRLADGTPVGTCFITKGPSKFDFFHRGLFNRSDAARWTGLDFQLAGLYEVRVGIQSARQLESWLCPELPSELSCGDSERDWQDAWEFTGYVPGEGIPVRGIYDVHTRKGVVHLWQAHVDDYGCVGAKHDLHMYFANGDNTVALLALERATKHMARGSVVGGHHVDCKECWELFKELRRSCELP